jgi:hypothetical protein
MANLFWDKRYVRTCLHNICQPAACTKSSDSTRPCKKHMVRMSRIWYCNTGTDPVCNHVIMIYYDYNVYVYNIIYIYAHTHILYIYTGILMSIVIMFRLTGALNIIHSRTQTRCNRAKALQTTERDQE